MGDDGAAMPWSDWLVSFLLLSIRKSYYPYGLAGEVPPVGGCDKMGPGEEMYRILQKLEEDGLIVSDRDGERSNLLWRWYEITERGEAHLKLWANALERYREEINLFLATYTEQCAGQGIEQAADPLAGSNRGSARLRNVEGSS